MYTCIDYAGSEQIITSSVSTEYGAVNWYKFCIYRIWGCELVQVLYLQNMGLSTGTCSVSTECGAVNWYKFCIYRMWGCEMVQVLYLENVGL